MVTGLARNSLLSISSHVRRASGGALIPHFLTDRVFKDAIMRAGPSVTQDLVNSFASLLHGIPAVKISNVHPVSHSATLSIARDLSNDVALGYSYQHPTASLQGNAALHLSTVLVENQRRPEPYFAARTVAHCSAQFVSALHVRADALTAARRTAGQTVGVKGAHKQSSMSTVYETAYPVQLIALCAYLPAMDDKGVWHSVTTLSPATAAKYTLHAPLLSTYRFSSPSPLIPFVRPLSRRSGKRASPDSFNVASPTPLGAALDNFMSITDIYLPATPDNVTDDDAWDSAVSLPEHVEALRNMQLRRWLHLWAHTEVRGRVVHLPSDLKGDPMFEAIAAAAQVALGGASNHYFSAREMSDFAADAKAEMLLRFGVSSVETFRAKMCCEPDAADLAAIALASRRLVGTAVAHTGSKSTASAAVVPAAMTTAAATEDTEHDSE